MPRLLPEETKTDLILFLDFANVWGVDYDSSIDDSNNGSNDDAGPILNINDDIKYKAITTNIDSDDKSNTISNIVNWNRTIDVETYISCRTNSKDGINKGSNDAADTISNINDGILDFAVTTNIDSNGKSNTA